MKQLTEIIEGFFDNVGSNDAVKAREIEVALTNILDKWKKYKNKQFQAIKDNPILKDLPKGTEVSVTCTYGSGEQRRIMFTPKYINNSWSCFDSWFDTYESYGSGDPFHRMMTWEDLLRKLIELSIGTLKFDIKFK